MKRQKLRCRALISTRSYGSFIYKKLGTRLSKSFNFSKSDHNHLTLKASRVKGKKTKLVAKLTSSMNKFSKEELRRQTLSSTITCSTSILTSNMQQSTKTLITTTSLISSSSTRTNSRNARATLRQDTRIKDADQSHWFSHLICLRLSNTRQSRSSDSSLSKETTSTDLLMKIRKVSHTMMNRNTKRERNR